MRFIYCPFCGQKLDKAEIGDEGLIPFCKQCNIPLWDMFTTSIIAACINQYDEIALLKQNYVSATKLVCVAGIMKLGESAEQTVIREVKEEIGLDVKSLTYIGSYPYDKKEMLMLGYKAIVDKTDFQISGEVDSVQWVKLDEALPLLREGGIKGDAKNGIAWQLVKTIINGSPENK